MNLRLLVLIIAIAFATYMLYGCAGAFPHELDNLARQGASPAQVSGYRDGCLAGEHAAGYAYSGFVKDFGRYEADSDYRDGWDLGYDVCLERMKDVKRTVSSARMR